MIIVLSPQSSQADREHIIETIKSHSLDVHISSGKERTIIGIIGNEELIAEIPFEIFSGVEKIMKVTKPYKRVSREFHPEPSIIEIGRDRNGVKMSRIGGGNFTVIAGPCSVESETQIIETAKAVKSAGANALRGGAYKPRTSPYSFQGHGADGLKMLAAARDATGLAIVTEVMDTRDVELVTEWADMIQIGARNMQNFHLLREVGMTRKPVLLKRGLSATIEDLLLSAEYILAGGNEKVALCERGIRTFEKAYRNTADLAAIPIIQELSHLPVVFDPSHSLGKRDHVAVLSCAAIAAGADGLMIEVHLNPENAMSDGPQCLDADKFKKCMEKIKPYINLSGKKLND